MPVVALGSPVGVGNQNKKGQELKGNSISHKSLWKMKSLQEGMAAKGLIVMILVTNICEGALLGKSSAYDFLQRVRERRGLGCFPGGCSTENSEVEELTDANVGYEENGSILYHGTVASKEINYKPEKPASETVLDEGSGM